MKQRWKSFAKTNKGRNIWFLHKQGYKFCEYIKDLTPEQEMFLIISNNLDVEESESDNSKINQKEQSNLVQEKIKNKLKNK
jgi:hypothetical protein